MPARVGLIDPFQTQITELVQQGRKQPEIISILKDTHNLTISRSTLQHRLKEWGLYKPQLPNTAAIEKRVRELTGTHNSSEILTVLEAENLPTSNRSLQRIRRRLGIKLRLTPEQREKQMAEIKEVILAEIQKGEIKWYSKRYRYLHFKRMGKPYTRDQIHAVWQELYPETSALRTKMTTRVYKEDMPNTLDSVSPDIEGDSESHAVDDESHEDGHMEPEQSGTETYNSIDGDTRRFIEHLEVEIAAERSANSGVLLEKNAVLPPMETIQPSPSRMTRQTKSQALKRSRPLAPQSPTRRSTRRKIGHDE
ncbi:hypothetical protein N7466_010497 [Penicillium verhagenii]|uniref:uncharacterized protein n=1 Tax=Penicillium verhagenii TaxID=1562060 RepID=UPI0025459F44|nr:uncharacterized protein N7466_010497 [Penicillium verhagenii]KAJ5918505.1 hypothetical protein N7466_010497 [Penicillium verhagenii]